MLLGWEELEASTLRNLGKLQQHHFPDSFLLRNAWVIDDKFVPGTSALLEIAYKGKSDKQF